MAKKPTAPQTDPTPAVSNGIEAMLLAAHAHGGDDLQTGRYLVTYKEGAQEAGMKAMKVQSLRTADARDFTSQAVDVGDADVLMFPENGVAVLDTGMDLGHADFAGRAFVTNTFVGQPVQDLHSHGTHCIGTACGPMAPADAPCPMPHAHHAHRASPPRLDHHRHRRPPGRRLGG